MNDVKFDVTNMGVKRWSRSAWDRTELASIVSMKKEEEETEKKKKKKMNMSLLENAMSKICSII